MTVRLDEMTWLEVKEALKKPHVILLPVGSTEQHGPHLPLNIDSFWATYLAEQTARMVTDHYKDVSILVAPTIHYTDVSCHKMFPGTVGVKVDTLIRIIEDIVKSFIEQGFKKIILCNSHLENNCSIEAALRKVASEFPNAGLYGVNLVALGFDVRLNLTKAGSEGMGHALEAETSMALAMQPHNVKLDRATSGNRKLPLSEKYLGASGMDRSKGVIYCTGISGWEESGIMGNPTLASKEEGEKIIEATRDHLADIVMQIMQQEW